MPQSEVRHPEQIIAEVELGMGHTKTGISIGELRSWVAYTAEGAG